MPKEIPEPTPPLPPRGTLGPLACVAALLVSVAGPCSAAVATFLNSSFDLAKLNLENPTSPVAATSNLFLFNLVLV
eukprot:CAMPEP_0201520716 /NCGR_PEP_ID=MMETSP0161_2-20130828/12226_1 /ASSEMBLY_ACC=CAM_ASM_000251 /TAXON_ID=180227 /ORGANISM="Neoparamoeba aestuarina, Strain SoJaBio B1-5/56/2" /LENGTH=75 /DNA_ID=CAMNT_0047919185 /DNA_START=137 /DNA_END=364 /DNA_ORIENTATION=-